MNDLNYSAIPDALITGFFLIVAVALLFQMAVDTIFWRKWARIIRVKAHFGGEIE